MKNLGITLAAVTALTLATLSAAEAQGKGRRDGAHGQRHAPMQHRASPRKFQHAVDRRQVRQRVRIREGRRSGALDRRELSRLRHGQKQVRRLERRFGADGRYSRSERRILKGALNHSSKRIWRMKHKRRARGPGYWKHNRRARGPGYWKHNRHARGPGYWKHNRHARGPGYWKHKRRARGPGYWKHKRYHHRFRRRGRHHPPVYHVYPVPQYSPGYSRGLEIETRDFRFRVDASG